VVSLIQTTSAAPPQQIAVTGVSDALGGLAGGEIVPDGGGNPHLNAAAFFGGFELHGDGVLITGSQIVVLNGVVDQTLSGPVAGSFTVTSDVNGGGATIWSGTVHGFVEGLIFTGRAVAQGQGPYAGQKLTLYFQERPATPENPNPEIFDLAGFLTRP